MCSSVSRRMTAEATKENGIAIRIAATVRDRWDPVERGIGTPWPRRG
jgi:hypothetical protein